MPKQIEVNGKRFGRLVVKDRKGCGNKCRCVCDCGNECIVFFGNLQKGNTKSCGCLKSGTSSSYWKGCGELSSSYFNHIKKLAKRRKIEFSIDIKEAWDKFEHQDNKCQLSKIDLFMNLGWGVSNRKRNQTQTASLDRIDSNIPYVIDNTQWIHKDVNMMKLDYDQDYFLQRCKEISYYANGETVEIEYGSGKMSQSFFGAIRYNATKKRGLLFEIDKEYVQNLFESQNGLCSLSGKKLLLVDSYAKNYKHQNASLDRIDSSKGYVKGNVQWLDSDINLMKGSLIQERFLEMCKLITENN